MKLRRSQIEVLQAVERYEGDQPSDRIAGASPAQVARAVDRTLSGVEESLVRLEALGLVEPIYHRLVSATYRLTDAGRQALPEEGR